MSTVLPSAVTLRITVPVDVEWPVPRNRRVPAPVIDKSVTFVVDDVAVDVNGTPPGLLGVSTIVRPVEPAGEMALMDCNAPPPATAVCTNAVVATFVDESARGGVGAVGVPMKAGELIGAPSVIP